MWLLTLDSCEQMNNSDHSIMWLNTLCKLPKNDAHFKLTAIKKKQPLSLVLQTPSNVLEEASTSPPCRRQKKGSCYYIRTVTHSTGLLSSYNPGAKLQFGRFRYSKEWSHHLMATFPRTGLLWPGAVFPDSL